MLFYTVEKDLYVEYLCVNNDKPELHCEGSCQLTKVDDFYQHQHQEKTTKISLIQTIWIIPNLFTHEIDQIYFPIIKHTPDAYQNTYTFLSSTFDFKPPIV